MFVFCARKEYFQFQEMLQSLWGCVEPVKSVVDVGVQQHCVEALRRYAMVQQNVNATPAYLFADYFIKTLIAYNIFTPPELYIVL